MIIVSGVSCSGKSRYISMINENANMRVRFAYQYAGRLGWIKSRLESKKFIFHYNIARPKGFSEDKPLSYQLRYVDKAVIVYADSDDLCLRAKNRAHIEPVFGNEKVYPSNYWLEVYGNEDPNKLYLSWYLFLECVGIEMEFYYSKENVFSVMSRVDFLNKVKLG